MAYAGEKGRVVERAPERVTTHAPPPLPPIDYVGRAGGRGPWRCADLREKFRGALTEERRFRHDFLFAPVALGLGAVIWFSLTRDLPLPAIFLLGALALGVVLAAGHHRPLVRYAAIAVLLLALGMGLAAFETWRTETVMLDTPIVTRVTGRIVNREIDDNGGWRYLVDISATSEPNLRRPPERAAILARNDHEPLLPGEGISGRARLSPPSGPALPDGYDFAFFSYYQGIGAVGFFYGSPDRVASGERASLSDRLHLAIEMLRDTISARIRATLSGDTGAFASAIVTGQRRALSDETAEALRMSGLAHVIAISGLHMALAAGLFFAGLRMGFALFPSLVHRFPVKKWAAAAALAGSFGYLLISGLQVSAIRAFIMLALMLVAVLMDRPAISLRNVALAALIILAITPSAVMGPSFQMSFAATVALVAGYRWWRMRPRGRSAPGSHSGLLALAAKAGGFVSALALTSAIGGVATAIFSLEHFHRLAPYGLVANLVAMPVVTFVVMPAGLVSVLAMPFGLEDWPLRLMGVGLDMVIAVAKEVTSWGGGVSPGRLPPYAFELSVAGFLLLVLLRSRLRYLGLPPMVAAVALIAVGAKPSVPALIISEDGSLGAMIAGGGLEMNRGRPPSFIFEQWQRALAMPKGEGPDMLTGTGPDPPKTEKGDPVRLPTAALKAERLAMEEALKPESNRFHCRKAAWCAAQFMASDGPALRVVTVEKPAFAGPACDIADLVIAPFRLGFDTCRSGAALISAERLRQTGSIELHVLPDGNGFEVKTALGSTDRPWTRHRYYDWRTNSFVSPEEPATWHLVPRSHDRDADMRVTGQ
ncbi:ComEC/Rec2 family competence protein [Rhizobium sp. NRK18]|uniref:ComEC/Rec2 family competence protein n=1 Tax=Rhizobium sp. NRK18 TaxID=2964667 RepID=UPI0021C3189B|nr:ComEC/Rec2 family competence protein [Rhizobium sp. NRK18]MCQ2004291.1 ComEC family competence protein [Rhizobium sp. NRK18]